MNEHDIDQLNFIRAKLLIRLDSFSKQSESVIKTDAGDVHFITVHPSGNAIPIDENGNALAGPK